MSSSPSPSPHRASSTEAFCWQHKDQAAHLNAPTQARPTPLQNRSSIDTLVDRLGILEVDPQKNKGKGRVANEDARGRDHASKNGSRPWDQQASQHLHGQHAPTTEHETSYEEELRGREKKSKSRSGLGLFCCVGETDEDNAPRPKQSTHTRSSSHVPSSSGTADNSHAFANRPPSRQRPSSRPATSSRPGTSPRPPTSRQPEMLQRPNLDRDPSSRTGEFLSLIPSTASPQVTSLLLAELAKPISESDAPGFIYMFWLTSETLPSGPPTETAGHLLAPPSRPDPGRRRTSDVLDSFTSAPPNRPSNEKTMLLKIGRAENVFRRLQQWQRQCGYNLSLIRYYPYNPSNPSANTEESGQAPRKVPNVHKVERLIHIELNAKRVKSGKCEACGKEHREWFEIDASRDGVKSVDEVIRRWTDWAERSAA
ncbi:meiotically up-regulated protein113-domain-containing [Rutstroemia sp. NJR-2017a WRK4]|nr:meiotically up-regulated protein113-domain-containing [Rutstroemia sp. NJR-2017a WRK4]